MPTCNMWNYYSRKYSSIAENTCKTYHFTKAEREGVFAGLVNLDNSNFSCPQTGFQWSGSSSPDTIREIPSWKECGNYTGYEI